MKGFDADENGLLDSAELTNWKEMVANQMAEWSWHPSEKTVLALKAGWTDAQVNGDEQSASMVEVANFVLNAWNAMLDQK